MIYQLFQKTIQETIKGSFSGVRFVGEGLRGSRRIKDSHGNIRRGNIAERLIDRRMKKIEDAESIGGKIAASTFGVMSDLTLGTFGAAMGWGARQIGKSGYHVGKLGAGITLDLAGSAAKMAGNLTMDAAQTGYQLINRNPNLAFVGGIVGAGAIGMGAHAMDNTVANQAIKMYGVTNEPLALADGMVGYMENQGGTSGSPHYVDTMGTSGDLVFAMHNLR